MGEKKRRLALGSPGPLLQAAPSVDELLTEANEYLDRGNARVAFEKAQQALALAPGKPHAQYLLGRCCLAVGQTQGGLGLLQSAVAAEPAEPTYRAELGRGLVAAGRLQDALDHLSHANSVLPDAQVSRDLGAVLLHLGRQREAEDAYARAAQLAPNRADLHEALARLRYERGAVDQACASFGRAVALDATLIDRLNIGYARCKAPRGVVADDALSDAWRLVRSGAALAGAASDADPGDRLRAACQARSLCIIDDLLDDPVAYRERALRLPFLHAAHQTGINYPGVQTAAQPCDAIMRRLADALGRDIKWDSPDNGAFRFSPQTATARNDVHVDSDVRSEIFAAVLYLSLPEHCRGGTIFWRHRATGWERRPNAEQLAGGGYASFAHFERRWMPVDRLRPFSQLQQERDRSWEPVLELPMRFNRLVAYRSDFFHSIGELFGDRPENARFVQLFFFEALGSEA